MSRLHRNSISCETQKKLGCWQQAWRCKSTEKSLDQEQEVLANIADIVSNVYAMESVLLRTEKGDSKKLVLKKNKQKLLYTQVFLSGGISGN
ncbi:hypothetical protein GCM10020331_028280 [Ectobacillus funiculus]